MSGARDEVVWHDLKTHPEPFAAAWRRAKTFEVRKWDRPFAVGDGVRLREWSDGYTGRVIMAEIVYVVPPGSWGLPSDVGVFGFREVGQQTHACAVRRCECAERDYGQCLACRGLL